MAQIECSYDYDRVMNNSILTRSIEDSIKLTKPFG